MGYAKLVTAVLLLLHIAVQGQVEVVLFPYLFPMEEDISGRVGHYHSVQQEKMLASTIKYQSLVVAENTLGTVGDDDECFLRTACVLGTLDEESVPNLSAAVGYRNFRLMLEIMAAEMATLGIKESDFPNIHNVLASFATGETHKDLSLCERLSPCATSSARDILQAALSMPEYSGAQNQQRDNVEREFAEDQSCFAKTACVVAALEATQLPSRSKARTFITYIRKLEEEALLAAEGEKVMDVRYLNNILASFEVGSVFKSIDFCDKLYSSTCDTLNAKEISSDMLQEMSSVRTARATSSQTCRATLNICPGISIGCALCGIFLDTTCKVQCTTAALYCGISVYACRAEKKDTEGNKDIGQSTARLYH